jgi:transposase
VDAAERAVLRRKLRRNEVLAFFAKLPPTVIGMEACGAAHYWARELRKLGHEVKLMAPQHVKAYVKRNKNDGRDGEARPRPCVPLAARLAEAQAAKTRGGGARQQDRPHRLEADDDGRELRRRADAWRIGARRLRDQPVGGFAAPAEPELQEENRW